MYNNKILLIINSILSKQIIPIFMFIIGNLSVTFMWEYGRIFMQWILIKNLKKKLKYKN